MRTVAFSGCILGGCLHNFNIGITSDVLLHHNRRCSRSRVTRHVNVPYFMGPTTSNDDFNIDGIGGTSRLTPTLHMTFVRDGRIVVRNFLSNARVSRNVCGATRGAIILPTARIMADGRFFSCSTGCGNRMRRVAPTHLSPRATRRITGAASHVCSVLRTGNVVHVSCVVSGSGSNGSGIGVLRVGAAPNVAIADFVPRRIHTTNLSVGGILDSVIRGRF